MAAIDVLDPAEIESRLDERTLDLMRQRHAFEACRPLCFVRREPTGGKPT
jgi:hypothetical protein